MKIAFISDSVYPFNKGGKETRSFELARNISNHKKINRVEFYTMKCWEGEKIIKKEGFYFHGICKNYPLYVKKIRSIKQGLLFGLSSLKLLKEDFDILDADHMVYFHLFPAKLVCLIKRKPMIITWHEVWGKEYWKSYLGRKGIIGAWMEKISAKMATKIISVSEHTTEKLVKELNVPRKKIITIPNGINIKEINNVKPNKEKFDVIFAGRLNGHKNIDILIKSIGLIKKTNPKIKCIIIGDGPEKHSLENLTRKLNLTKNITFKGFLQKHDDVISFIKASKVFVLPSIREGFGISVIEANACGIPVITTNHKDNAAKNLIKEGKNGFTISLNKKNLSNRIETTLKKSHLMKEDCKKSAKQYDWKNIIEKFKKVYHGVIKNGKK